MKIDKINSCAPAKNIQFKQKSFYSAPYALDSVSFTGKNKEKISFWDKITGKHKKEQEIEITPEYEKSEDIKHFLGSLLDNIDEFKKQGKDFYSFTKNEFKIAMAENFRGRVKTSRNETILYSDFDKSTGMPKKGEVRLIDDWTKIKREYRFYDDSLERYDMIDYTNPKFDVVFSMYKNNVIKYEETEKATGLVKELIPTKEGFQYFEGKRDEKGRTTELFYNIKYNSEISQKSAYCEQNNEGKIVLYLYNEETDMWELQ